MDNSHKETVPRAPLRHIWLFAIVPLAALAWAGLAAHMNTPQNPWRQKLNVFRDDRSADVPVGQSPRMAEVLILRNHLMRSIGERQPTTISSAQSRLLADCLNGPVDERAQSEALDVLTLAQRAGILSSAQADDAIEACLAVLRRTPPPMVRLEGARFLWHSKTPKGIAALRLLLNDPSPKIRATARQGLAEISREAPPKAALSRRSQLSAKE